VQAVFDVDPDRYDAVLTLAEIQMARAERSGDPAWLTSVLDTLGRADRLEGCGNRVELVRAQALLARARLAAASGDDPRADLEAVLAKRDASNAQTPDNQPWVTIIEEAERTLVDYTERKAP
jgi:hypothetical protein